MTLLCVHVSAIIESSICERWDVSNDQQESNFGLIKTFTFTFISQEHEVDKMYPLRPGRLPNHSVQNIVYIVRPKQSIMDIVAQNVLKWVHHILPLKIPHTILQLPPMTVKVRGAIS